MTNIIFQKEQLLYDSTPEAVAQIKCPFSPLKASIIWWKLGRLFITLSKLQILKVSGWTVCWEEKGAWRKWTITGMWVISSTSACWPVMLGKLSRQQRGCSNWNLQSGESGLCVFIIHVNIWSCSERFPPGGEGVNAKNNNNCYVFPSDFFIKAKLGQKEQLLRPCLVLCDGRERQIDRHPHTQCIPACCLQDKTLSPINLFRPQRSSRAERSWVSVHTVHLWESR